MKSSNGKKKRNDGIQNNEVEQLLQAAEDEVLLKLSVDSHISHTSSNYLDADLDRRFQALRSRPSIPRSTSAQSQSQSQSQSKPQSPVVDVSKSQSRVDVDDELKSVLGDDLSARFAALKASSSSSNNNNNNSNNGIGVGPNISSVDEDDNEDDEVEKLIRWAKDAARLDPSPPSDDDPSDDDDDGKDSDCDSHSDDDDDKPHRKKGHRK